MTQLSFATLGHRHKKKRTKREAFLAEMEAVVPWALLLGLIEPYYPKSGNGRRPYPLAVMLRIYFLQQSYQPEKFQLYRRLRQAGQSRYESSNHLGEFWIITPREVEAHDEERLIQKRPRLPCLQK